MRISLVLNLIGTAYVVFRLCSRWVLGTGIPRHVWGVVLYLVLPYLIQLATIGEVLEAANQVVLFLTGWKFFVFLLCSWALIEVMYSKSYRVRLFFNRHRKFLFRAALWYLCLVMYSKISDHYTVDNGTCKALTAYEYFKQPREVKSKGKFVAVFCNSLMVFGILIGSCVFSMYFYVPITIA